MRLSVGMRNSDLFVMVDGMGKYDVCACVCVLWHAYMHTHQDDRCFSMDVTTLVFGDRFSLVFVCVCV